MSMRYKKVKYGFKKFILYLMFALPACNIPFFWIGMIFGVPAVLFASIFLSIYDAIHLDQNSNMEVFTPEMWLIWASEMVIGISIVIVFYIFIK